MKTNRLRALPATGIVVSLLIAAGPVAAHDYRHGYAPRYLQRAVVVTPPGVVTYGYGAAPVYYAPPPPPVYVPAPAYYRPPPLYYAPRAYYGPSIRIAAYGGHGRAHRHR